mmetsp:Transcript_29590/g.44834  ORF Transcript_29590/g.44834 Transcript_29590/m.44834 type:complete len:118 (+) Transcript_29590:528-881(+)
MQHDLSWLNAPPDCDCGNANYKWNCAKREYGREAICRDQQHSECATYCCEEDVKFSRCLKSAATTQNNYFWDWSDRSDNTCNRQVTHQLTNETSWPIQVQQEVLAIQHETRYYIKHP